jgi:GGDEF domain-containing protein
MPVNRRDDNDVDQDCGPNDKWHDLVTGLPRPRSFLEHLERALALPGRPPQSVAMLLLRVADLQVPMARSGRPCCDEVLRIIAERLHEEAPEPNLVTRLCGGDFAIVLRDLGPEVTAEALATRLLERASEPCPSEDRLLRCSVIGALVLSGADEETAMELLDRALWALTLASIRSGSQAHRSKGSTERRPGAWGVLAHLPVTRTTPAG